MLAAIAAGLLAGLFVTVVQHFTTTPLILQAETFEKPAHVSSAHGGVLSHGMGEAAPQASGGAGIAIPPSEEQAVAIDWERLLFTALANLLAGVGFALMVVAAFALRGQPVDARTGLAWGAAGFSVMTLAPALGMPPELPGLIAADLADRQLWWIFAAGAAAVGLGLLAFGRSKALKVGGVAIALLPHLAGAPHPEAMGSDVPPELASQFVAVSIAVSALFWAVLGWLSATFYRRFGETS